MLAGSYKFFAFYLCFPPKQKNRLALAFLKGQRPFGIWE
jgi:hypothetical protein